jgi:hypothetical protein
MAKIDGTIIPETSIEYRMVRFCDEHRLRIGPLDNDRFFDEIVFNRVGAEALRDFLCEWLGLPEKK